MSDSARREGRENYVDVECCAEELLIKLMVMVMVVMMVVMMMMIALKHVDEGGCVQEGGT